MSKYCTKCGSRLEEGMRFCTQCGMPITGSLGPDTTGVDTIVSDASTPTEVPESRPLPYAPVSFEPTQTMQFPSNGADCDDSAFADTQHTAYMPSENARKGRGASAAAKALIAVLSVAVIVAAAALVIVLHPWDSGAASDDNSVSSSQTAPSASSNRSASNAADSSSSNAGSSANGSSASSLETSLMSDSEAKSTLRGMLGQIDAFDSRIVNAAANYNNHILGSATERQNGFDSTLGLQHEIEDAIAKCNAYAISSQSRFYDAWSLEKRMLDDLYHRIYVIQKGWERSLDSNDIDYINEYIAADNVDGVNRYKADFEQARNTISIPE